MPESFTMHVPDCVARRLRFAATESRLSPAAYIGGWLVPGLATDLDTRSSPVSVDENADTEAIKALNPVESPQSAASLTIKLTPQTMARLRMCAAEHEVTPEEYAADNLGESVPVVAQNILDEEDPDKQRKVEAALNQPPKRKRKCPTKPGRNGRAFFAIHSQGWRYVSIPLLNARL